MENQTIDMPEIVQENSFISKDALFIIQAVNIAVLTLIFSLLGSVTNILNMIVFLRVGFSDPINITLMAVAVSDFGSCFTMLGRTVLLNPWFQRLDNLSFDSSDVSFLASLWPHITFVKVTHLLTAFISIERCLCVTMPLKVKSLVTEKRVKIIVIFIYTLVILTCLPIYYTKRYGWKFSPKRNKTILVLVYAKEKEHIEPLVFNTINFGYTLVPFFFISFATLFLVLSLKKNMKWRQKTISVDSKLSSKETKVSRMVIVICVIYIACFCPHSAVMLYSRVTSGLTLDGIYKHILTIIGSHVFLLQCVNSSCNIFVYYRNSSVYKNTFLKIFIGRKTNDVTHSK